MNEVLAAILGRRSVRKYSEEPVSDGEMDAILQAGSYAPTARNTQAWYILALLGLERIRALDAQVKEAAQVPGFDRYKDFVGSPSYTINYRNAPLFVIVGVNPDVSVCPVEDGSLVLGNILLAAHGLGLGACWINQLGAICDEPGFRKYLTGLGFPKTHKVIGSCCVGRIEGEVPRAPARKHGQINVLR
ncbi:MAG: nitroreductase family protein [Deltaproteobacteria bacterium]|jgi:nitroreductase|nr:nitroreductase family protein [Deltaproteobacteria bacterium]